MGVSDATIAPRRLASASVHARASLVRAATRWGSPTATKPRRAALVRRGLVKWREDAARARRHGRAPSLRPPSACAGRHLAAGLRLPARLRSVASRDSARAGAEQIGEAADGAREMRSLGASPRAARSGLMVVKETHCAATDWWATVRIITHDATSISAPGPSIVFGSIKVVLLRRLHLDRPFFRLVMGRAED